MQRGGGCLVVPYDGNTPDPTILAYDFLKYHQGFVEPEDVFPDSLKQWFLNRMQWGETNYGGKTVSGFLADLETDGYIDQFAKNKFTTLDQRLSTPTSFSGNISWLESEIVAARADSTIACLGRYLVLSVFQSYKNALTYYEEVADRGGYLDGGTPSILTRSIDCDFWDRLGCIFNADVLLYTIIGAVVGCNIENIIEGNWDVVLGENIGFDLNSLTFFLRCAVQFTNPVNMIGAGIGAAIGLIYGIVSRWEECECPDCDDIKSMPYRFVDCAPRADFLPRGYGEDIVLFSWSNENGAPMTATTSPGQSLRILDVSSSSEDLRVQCEPMCSDGQYELDEFDKSFDLQQEYLLPRSLALNGPTMLIEAQSSLQITYNVLATNWMNISRYDWNFWVQNGTIVSQSSNSVTIQWNSSASEGEVGINYWRLPRRPTEFSHCQSYCVF